MKHPAFLLGVLLILSGTSGPAVAQASDSGKVFPWKAHFQTRYSIVDGRLLSIWGGSVGYAWGPYQHEATLGYHWLGNRGTRQFDRIERAAALADGQLSYSRVGAQYLNAGYWHMIRNSRRWKMGFPIEIGIGKATARSYSFSEKPLPDPVREATYVPVHLGYSIEWKATRWVGLGFQGGYRRNLVRFEPAERLDGPFGRIRVMVYPVTYADWFRFLFRGERLASPFYKKEEKPEP